MTIVKSYSDKHGRVNLNVFKVGELVLLDTKNLPLKVVKHRFIGPFVALGRHSSACTIDLPKSVCRSMIRRFEDASWDEIVARRIVAAPDSKLGNDTETGGDSFNIDTGIALRNTAPVEYTLDTVSNDHDAANCQKPVAKHEQQLAPVERSSLRPVRPDTVMPFKLRVMVDNVGLLLNPNLSARWVIAATRHLPSLVRIRMHWFKPSVSNTPLVSSAEHPFQVFGFNAALFQSVFSPAWQKPSHHRAALEQLDYPRAVASATYDTVQALWEVLALQTIPLP
ncbi:Pol protein [Phytophthora palmivora]|uniref:Pol protein n=1 Tax=Phytophthora palmivora TaxID=4796 RepID=A0A2P4YG95_9STRA|nr:Pol protein [Phytophthora palmivora]